MYRWRFQWQRNTLHSAKRTLYQIGSANEDAGNPVYDGKQRTWVNEEIVLNNYANKDIKIQFTLKSDASTNADGYYFDDFSVSIIDMSSVGIEDQGNRRFMFSGPVPNPASGNVQIRYRIPGSLPAELDLMDSHGITIKKFVLNDSSGTIDFSTENYPSGIYFTDYRDPLELQKWRNFLLSGNPFWACLQTWN